MGGGGLECAGSSSLVGSSFARASGPNGGVARLGFFGKWIGSGITRGEGADETIVWKPSRRARKCTEMHGFENARGWGARGEAMGALGTVRGRNRGRVMVGLGPKRVG